MKPLPGNAAELAKRFSGLSDDRKDTVLGHLQALSGANQQQTINQIISNGGEEGRFVAHLLSKQVPGPDDSPDNKMTASVQVK